MYHLKESWEVIQKIPVYERKWILERFVEQKKAEEEEQKKAAKQSKGRRR